MRKPAVWLVAVLQPSMYVYSSTCMYILLLKITFDLNSLLLNIILGLQGCSGSLAFIPVQHETCFQVWYKIDLIFNSIKRQFLFSFCVTVRPRSTPCNYRFFIEVPNLRVWWLQAASAVVEENKHLTKGSSDHLNLKCPVRGSCFSLLAVTTHLST